MHSLHSRKVADYNTRMMKTTRTNEANTTDWHESAFDMIRGLAAYTGSSLVAGLARVVARYPDADIGTAFNHKQVACKIWARDRLFESLRRQI